jgi:hypothetical protein
MARGGKRPGAGRRPKPQLPEVPKVEAGQWVAELITTLEQPKKPKESKQIADWRLLWEAQDLRIRLDTRKFLYEQLHGKARHTVNHLHDKPIDLNVNLSMAEIVREVRHRKEQYERSRK